MKKNLFKSWYEANKDSEMLKGIEKKEAKKIYSSVYNSVMNDVERKIIPMKSLIGIRMKSLAYEKENTMNEIEKINHEKDSIVNLLTMVYDETSDKKNDKLLISVKRYLGGKLFACREKLKHQESLESRIKEEYRMISSLLR